MNTTLFLLMTQLTHLPVTLFAGNEMQNTQQQERRLRQTTARRTTSNSSKVKQNISEQSLNAKGGDGGKGHNKAMEFDTKALDDEGSKG
jgi:hypothetical protein